MFSLNKLVQKVQYKYFHITIFLRGRLGLPAQNGNEVALFKKLFRHFLGKKINIFEWGSGFSTIYYSKYLRKMGLEFQWVSIDNDEIWHKKVKAMVEKEGLTGHIQLYVKGFTPFWKKQGWQWENLPPPRGVFGPNSGEEKDYVNFSKSFNEKFDVVVVDARFRRHCLQTAKDSLAPGGIVILHDAQKVHYHSGTDGYRYKKFMNTGTWYPFQEIPNKVWIGSMDNKELVDSLAPD